MLFCKVGELGRHQCEPAISPKEASKKIGNPIIYVFAGRVGQGDSILDFAPDHTVDLFFKGSSSKRNYSFHVEVFRVDHYDKLCEISRGEFCHHDSEENDERQYRRYRSCGRCAT
jgi:hypothetical protein